MPETSAWFFDSVTLSNFALVDGLQVLVARYKGRGFLVTQVVDELARGVAAGHGALSGCLALVDQGILRVKTLDQAERATFGRLLSHLGQGESGTIAAGLHRRGVVVTDDRAARQTCSDLGVPVTGTIGILQAAVRDGQLVWNEADGLLQKMIAAGFHSPVTRLPLETPKLAEFESLVAKSRSHARHAGLKQADVAKAVRKVRNANRTRH